MDDQRTDREGDDSVKVSLPESFQHVSECFNALQRLDALLQLKYRDIERSRTAGELKHEDQNFNKLQTELGLAIKKYQGAVLGMLISAAN
jgi:hypothetical protein